MKNKYIYIVVDVVNGEGYSSPNIKMVDNSAEVQLTRHEFINSYGDDFGEVESYTTDKMVFTYGDDDDGAVIQVLELNPSIRYHMIRVRPEILDVQISYSANELYEVMGQLRQIVLDGGLGFEADEIVDFEQGDGTEFGSHCADDEFIFFKIIDTREINGN